MALGVDSFSILFNRSFQKPDPFSGGFPERRIPGKNEEATPRMAEGSSETSVQGTCLGVDALDHHPCRKSCGVC